MERLDDIRQRLTERRMTLCTAQRVRESIIGSLMGVRVQLRAGVAETPVGRVKLRERCTEIRAQLHVLLRAGERRHVKTALRILQAYEAAIEEGDATLPS